ncbi:probable phosphoglycerate mutase [Evansella caseinilytica]|uniref:Probable phosphoglycerate mutase n=1 Tax=Evansella caseinilytica TaxID=1503961 RepID=A0A1H3Q9F0_9BACI|nr:histidine phosphatase family protein [Evansella caseinilytica]SDZ10162.1 probable phosphoglycerate mutase [Evansella caseinilytica]
MLTLYITRHGETLWNTQKKMQGWNDCELTEKGKKNARYLSARLKETTFHSVYSSPSKRAVSTTTLICSGRSILNSSLW